ncbi:hypothetical protein [Senegalimassilia faecalis]|nr:hypothetical protein [Senegalimassilia faecalis]
MIRLLSGRTFLTARYQTADLNHHRANVLGYHSEQSITCDIVDFFATP